MNRNEDDWCHYSGMPSPKAYEENMKYITILDFNTGIVHQLTIDRWNIDEETCEQYMERIGFDSNNCHWMVHEKGGVQFAI